jgi:pimeloyl-ACP methyl ester carboxylesterase
MPVLYYVEAGAGPPVLLLHGLFGSSGNLRGLAQALSARYRVIAADLRNHGRSPHADSMSYAEMAGDLLELLDRLEIARATLIGHSMGGKVAMALSLAEPERVTALAALDIAPTAYARRYDNLIAALQALELAGLISRQDADRRLRVGIPNHALRLFLLQNLVRDGGRFHWRLNLDGLARNMDRLQGFPEFETSAFSGPALFLRGGTSGYVTDENHPVIRARFPNAVIDTVPDAGHWLHVERPADVNARLLEFLDRHAAR